MNYDDSVQLHLQILEKKSSLFKRTDIEYSEPFSCPFALATVPVIESSEKDLSFSDGVILYLYDIGFRSFEKMSALSSIPVKVISSSYNLLTNIDRFIDEEKEELTDLGKEALNNFKKEEYRNMVHIRSQRNIQIEAITGSIVPVFLEVNNLNFAASEDLPSPLPELERLIIDEMVYSELSKRLAEYNKHHIKDGYSIIGVEEFGINRIMYGDSIMVKYRNFKNPLIVPMISNDIILKAQEKMDYQSVPIYPVAYSEAETTDIPDIVRRSDDYFAPLREYVIQKTSKKGHSDE